jgi:hypothetical protein
MNNNNRISWLKISNLWIGAALLIVTASANETYSTVILKGSDVKAALSNFPNFNRFDFTYAQESDGNYTLRGYAQASTGGNLGNLIVLNSLSSGPKKNLKNLTMGHLYLTLKTMRDQVVDGSENYILTPRKYKSDNGTTMDYVSYRFNNHIDESLTSDEYLGVRAFTLNPSPPAWNDPYELDSFAPDFLNRSISGI